jgi:hypothetical protein
VCHTRARIAAEPRRGGAVRDVHEREPCGALVLVVFAT